MAGTVLTRQLDLSVLADTNITIPAIGITTARQCLRATHNVFGEVRITYLGEDDRERYIDLPYGTTVHATEGPVVPFEVPARWGWGRW